VPRGIVPTGGEWITRLRTRGRPAVVPVAAGAATAGSAGGAAASTAPPAAADVPPASRASKGGAR
jgi:hypothetical protein